MKTVPLINFSKSIEKKWLVYNESYFDKFDTFTHIFVTAVLWFGTIILITSQQNFNENERFFIYIFILIDLFIFFVTFKKLTEKRLKVIETKCNEEENRKMIKKLCKERGWYESKISSNALVIYDDIDDFSKYIKIFFLKNNKIYFTVLTERFRLNYPTLTENYSIKKQIKNSGCC